MKKIIVAIAAIAACSLALVFQPAMAREGGAQDTAAQPSQAPKHEPPPVLEIARETVKEGRAAAHEKVEADYAATFRKHNFPEHYLGLESMSGPGAALFLVGFPSFAEVETSNESMEKPGVKSELDMLDARDGELRAGSSTMYAVYRKDLSYRPDLANPVKTRYFEVTAFRVKLGHEQGFEEGDKKFMAAYEKADIKTPFVTYQVVSGSPEGLYLIFGPMQSLKEMDDYAAREKAIADAMGEDYQQMMKGTGDVFNSIESSLYAVNPRMSYVGKDVEDADPAFWRTKPAVAKTTTTTTEKKTDKAGQ